MNLRTVLFLSISILLLTACKQEPQQDKPKVDPDTIVAEVAIIRGFSVRDSAGIMVADALRAMQSVEYNAKGQELANKFFNQNGTVAWEDQFLLNEEGQKIGSRYYENGELKMTYKYDLDDQGRRVGYRAHDANTGVEMYRGFSKYENGGGLRIDGSAPGPNAVVQWNYEYSFDKNGEETGYVYIAADGKRFPSTYSVKERDEQGRWLRRAVVTNDTVTAIETREFKSLTDSQ